MQLRAVLQADAVQDHPLGVPSIVTVDPDYFLRREEFPKPVNACALSTRSSEPHDGPEVNLCWDLVGFLLSWIDLGQCSPSAAQRSNAGE